MNNAEDILSILDSVDYLDMHIHLEDYMSEDIQDNILYLANSINRDTYNRTLQLASEKKNVVPSLGIHPAKCHENIPDQLMEHILSRSAFSGEIGLDFFWIEDENTYADQIETFTKQLKLSKKYNTIPSIHTKRSEKEVLKYLKEYDVQKSIIHWYSGPEELIEGFLNQGCYFTIGPDIFTKSTIYKMIPMEKMFAETDNPTGMPWIQESEHSAKDIIKIYEKLSILLELDTNRLINQFKENLKTLLAL